MRLAIFTIAFILPPSVLAHDIRELSQIQFSGEIVSPDNISGIAFFGDGQFLVIGADEGRAIQILSRTSDAQYSVSRTIDLITDNTDDEIDIEGVASSGNGTFYVVGSHSRNRPTIKATKTMAENRKRLETSKQGPLRTKLFRLHIDGQGSLTGAIDIQSLSSRIESDVLLKPFAEIASKENGVDIEGIAAHGDKLFAAFRGPVLREGHVPILKFDFDRPDKAKTLLINLGGRGIRDIARVNDGFLLIGGPVGDEPLSYELYHWSGEDGVEGTDGTSPVKPLGTIPVPSAEAKAEGLAVLHETPAHYDVLIVFDGITNGAPTLCRAQKSE